MARTIGSLKEELEHTSRPGSIDEEVYDDEILDESEGDEEEEAGDEVVEDTSDDGDDAQDPPLIDQLKSILGEDGDPEDENDDDDGDDDGDTDGEDDDDDDDGGDLEEGVGQSKVQAAINRVLPMSKIKTLLLHLGVNENTAEASSVILSDQFKNMVISVAASADVPVSPALQKIARRSMLTYAKTSYGGKNRAEGLDDDERKALDEMDMDVPSSEGFSVKMFKRGGKWHWSIYSNAGLIEQGSNASFKSVLDKVQKVAREEEAKFGKDKK